MIGYSYIKENMLWFPITIIFYHDKGIIVLKDKHPIDMFAYWWFNRKK